jgi:hypothetical protein
VPLGVLHVALLPSSQTDASSSNGESVPSKAGSALLLLMPMLVLPAAAAAELQQHWQQAAAAAVDDEAADTISIADVWSKTIAPLTTDVAYLLSVCKDTSSWPVAAAAAGPLPEGVRAVLQQLLAQLAACGMWATMQLLVECATEAAADFAAAAAAGSNAAAVKEVEAEDNAVSSCSSSVAAELEAVDTPTATSISNDTGVFDVGSSSRSSSGPLKPAAAADDNTLTTLATCSSGAFEKGSCSRSSSGPLKPAAAAAGKPHQDQLLTDAAGRSLSGIAVHATSLLWGFDNPQLEDCYQAAAFSSSRAMDLATLVYGAAVGLSCYYARGSSSQQLQQQLLQQHNVPGLLVRSQIVAMVVCVVGPIAVLAHRWRVGRKLQAMQQQHEQQHGVRSVKEKACRVSFDTADTGSSRNIGPSNSANNSNNSSVASSSYAAKVQAELVAAAHTKHLLWIVWMMLVLAWGLMILSGRGVLEPIVVIKLWSRAGWSDNMGALVSWALKGWTTQVRITAELLDSVFVCCCEEALCPTRAQLNFTNQHPHGQQCPCTYLSEACIVLVVALPFHDILPVL